MRAIDPVSVRPVPGTELHASSIGLRIEPRAPGTPLSGRRSVALLANARSRGITTLDLGEGAGSFRVERWVREAFPSSDPDLLILVHRSLDVLAEEAAHDRSAPSNGDLEARLRHSLGRSAERLRPHPIGVLLWQPSADAEDPAAEMGPVMERLKAEGAFASWGLSIASVGTRSGTGIPVGPVPALLSGALSPLDPSLLPSLAERGSHDPFGFFVQDPMGGGRLDGTRFAGSLADRRPDARPVNVRELRREFSPVLRLGFLTEGKHRTLAQASLGFALRWPWVCSALVPLPSPERLEELIRAESTPPLSDAEVDRILALTH